MSEAGISDPGEVTSILEHVRRHQFPVQLLAPEASAPETSMLLVADAGRQQLIFDAPRYFGSGVYDAGNVLTAMTTRNGAEVRFETQVIGTEPFEGYPALRTTWPRSIISRQRRKAFRVRIGEDMSSRLELYDEAGQRIRGQLTDLSLGGFGALIDRNAPLVAGEEIDSSLEIEGVLLATSINVNELRSPEKGRFMRIGAAFTTLLPQQQAQLEKLIRAIERHAIRSESAGL